MAELIKCGAMLDYRLLESLESERDDLLRLDGAQLEEVVSTAVRLKSGVVAGDELDYSSRMLLNFGHTIGHAIEAATAYKGYSHGEAIAVGMVAEAKISRALGLMSETEMERLEGLISAYGLPTHVTGVTPESIAQLISHDKKVRSGRWRISLPKKLGEGMVIEDPPREVVLSAIRGVIED
jgi:3-dehydroquinate synthase